MALGFAGFGARMYRSGGSGWADKKSSASSRAVGTTFGQTKDWMRF
jgi:hypothetical protein